MNKTGRWSYNDHGNEYWNNDDYESREDAIEAAFQDEDFVKENSFKLGDDFFLSVAIGQLKQPTICDGRLIAENVIEIIQEHHCDVYGEYGCDYLDDVTKEQIKELDEALIKVIDKWATKNSLQPRHYLIENVEEDEFLIEDIETLERAKESDAG